MVKIYQSEEEEKKKSLLIWVSVLLMLILLIVLVNLRFQTITVLGNTTYSDEEVIEMVFPGRMDKNPIYSFVKTKFFPHRSFPFVSSYKVHFTGPVSCEIILYEKALLGYIDYMSSFMYFDKDGTIIESTSRRKTEIPEITGLKFGRIVMGEKLDVRDANLFEEIMNITQQLSIYDIHCCRIAFDDAKNVTLFIDDGTLKVKLGTDEYLAAKLAVLGDVIGQMRSSGLKGTADLSNYRDRTSDRFVFIREDDLEPLYPEELPSAHEDSQGKEEAEKPEGN